MKHPFLKLLLLFMALFAINILVFAGLNRLGFEIEMTGVSYLFPPTCACLVLYLLASRNK